MHYISFYTFDSYLFNKKPSKLMAVGRAMCCRCTTGPSGNPTDGTKAVEGMAAAFGVYIVLMGLETQLLQRQKPYSRQLKIKISSKILTDSI